MKEAEMPKEIQQYWSGKKAIPKANVKKDTDENIEQGEDWKSFLTSIRDSLDRKF